MRSLLMIAYTLIRFLYEGFLSSAGMPFPVMFSTMNGTYHLLTVRLTRVFRHGKYRGRQGEIMPSYARL